MASTKVPVKLICANKEYELTAIKKVKNDISLLNFKNESELILSNYLCFTHSITLAGGLLAKSSFFMKSM